MCPPEEIDHDAPLAGLPTFDLTVNVVATAVDAELNPVLLAADPREETAYPDNEDEDGVNWDINTRSWQNIAPFLADRIGHVNPPYVKMHRNLDCDFRRDGEAQYNDLFLTTDPQIPVKLVVEQNEGLQVGFDWRVVTIWVVGANLGQLLAISELLVEIAQGRQGDIDKDDDAYTAMYESRVDDLESPLKWRRRFREEGVYEFVRKVNGRREPPEIYWEGTSA